MNGSRKNIHYLVALILALVSGLSQAETPQELLKTLDDFPHAQGIANTEQQVFDYELGLGSIKKVRGTWGFKRSERKSGRLQTFTWQIVDGFSSEEVMQSLQNSLEQDEHASVLFTCDGRSCGQGVQWANRVFKQRVLYGREDLQHYRIYSLRESQGSEYRLVIYSASRSADRQYLHVELLQIEE